MTIQEAINRADGVKPNAFTTAEKVAWISALEGSIAAEVFMMSPAELQHFNYDADDLTKVLLVDPPYDDLYVLWLEAVIDEKNGEYDKYRNTREVYEARRREFCCWFFQNWDPACGYIGEERLYGII